jgi:hypothetical protein
MEEKEEGNKRTGRDEKGGRWKESMEERASERRRDDL